jgi:transcription initiation factor TFIIB
MDKLENLDDDELWDLLSTFAKDDDDFEPNDSIKCSNVLCSSEEFTIDETNSICVKCGTIQSKSIDLGAEWRYYGANDNKSSNPTRCGMPTNDFLPKSSLGSIIGNENISKNYYQLSRIRKYHMWNSMPYKERSLYAVISALDIKASNGGISQSIIDDAKSLYKVISETKITRGANRNGLIASSIYMSCKNNNVPRSAKEIATIFNIDITTMTRGCKKFHEIMKNKSFSCTYPSDFILRFCSKLNKPDIVDTCIYIVNKADEYSIVSENAPPSIAAGSIYLCCTVYKHDITKKDISKACEISEVTINKCFKKLEQYKSVLLPPTPSTTN